MTGWAYAVEAIGVRGLHFHDLRHTGNAFAAASGAGIKDLMARMGHDSERVAMIYLHEMRGADRAIASAIDAHVTAERGSHDGARSGGALMARILVGGLPGSGDRVWIMYLTWAYALERAKGIEPS